MHGDRDDLFPLELAVELYRGIQGAALWVVPFGHHEPPFGARAAAFAEVAGGFLRGELDPAPASGR